MVRLMKRCSPLILAACTLLWPPGAESTLCCSPMHILPGVQTDVTPVHSARHTLAGGKSARRAQACGAARPQPCLHPG